jgi:hypothetical protein
MRFSAKRLIGAGVIGVAAIVTPLSLTVALSGVGSAPSSVAGAQGPFDEIVFNQTTGTPADTDQYLPAGGVPTPNPAQGLNVSGNCATTTGGGTAILSICGEVYSSLSYIGAPKAASLGTNVTATGVSAISPAWTIDNKSNKGAEAIQFSPGDPKVIGSNRVLTGAQIPVQRKDTGNTGISQVNVQLAELDSSGTVLGTQNCTIAGNTGTQILADPNNAALCPVGTAAAGGGVPSTFQTIEVRDTTSSTSISVVEGTSAAGAPISATFELATSVCSGQTVGSVDQGGGAVASLSLPPAAPGTAPVCKSYTAFTSTIDPNTGLSTVSFNGFSSTNVQLTLHIVWPAVPLCSPYVDAPGSPAPGGTTGITDAPGVVGGAVGDMCPVHSFQLNGAPFTDQGYCQTSQAPGAGIELQQELCTVTKNYNNDVLNPDGTVALNPDGTVKTITTSTGAPGTQIVENWVGDVDMRLH